MTTAGIEGLSYLEMYVNLNLPSWLRHPEPPPCPRGHDPQDWAKRHEAQRNNAVDRLTKEYLFKLGKGWLPVEIIDGAAVRELSGGVPVRVVQTPKYVEKQAAILVKALRERGLLRKLDWRTVCRLTVAARGEWDGHAVFIGSAIDDATRVLATVGEQQQDGGCDCAEYCATAPERSWLAFAWKSCWEQHGCPDLTGVWRELLIYRHNRRCCPPCLPIPQPEDMAAQRGWESLLARTGNHWTLRLKEGWARHWQGLRMLPVPRVHSEGGVNVQHTG